MNQEVNNGETGQVRQETPFSYEAFIRETGALINLAYSYYDIPRYDDEVNEARRNFFMVRPDEELVISALKPIDRYNFILWFLCDYRLKENGKSPVEHFFSTTMARDLTEDQKELLERIGGSYLSVYDLLETVPETSSVTLRELFTSRAVKLEDSRISRLADSTVFFALRVIRWGDRHYSCGDIYAYPDDMRDHLLMILQRRLVDPRAIVPPSLEEMLKLKGYIFNHIQMAVRNTDNYVRPRQGSPEETNEKTGNKTEPEPKVGICRAHFAVLDYDRVKALLGSTPSVLFSEDTTDGPVYLWFRKKGSPDGDRENGKILLTRRKLIFETMGIDDLEGGKSDLIKALKPHIQHTFDDLEKRRVTS